MPRCGSRLQFKRRPALGSRCSVVLTSEPRTQRSGVSGGRLLRNAACAARIEKDRMTIVPLEYRRKIKTREELLAAIGPRPRLRKVIMCHGTFDLVHPGHVRHLMYAKSKADILVASLTCDAHISKANFRPFVPQQLRAMNLAAFEPVDYVIIDESPTPIDTIKFLQPDFFAKGYEYFDGGVHPRTRDEITALESYGGEI